jgi:hypothetical protein
MNFQLTLTDSGVAVNQLLYANSWSSCLAYCEGTGFIINNILLLSSNISVVINDATSQNCFNIFFISKETNIASNYFVFDTDFETLQTWLNTQTDKTVRSIQTNKNSYVTV